MTATTAHEGGLTMVIATETRYGLNAAGRPMIAECADHHGHNGCCGHCMPGGFSWPCTTNHVSGSANGRLPDSGSGNRGSSPLPEAITSESSKGRTAGLGPVDEGSIPSSEAKTDTAVWEGLSDQELTVLDLLAEVVDLAEEEIEGFDKEDLIDCLIDCEGGRRTQWDRALEGLHGQALVGFYADTKEWAVSNKGRLILADWRRNRVENAT